MSTQRPRGVRVPLGHKLLRLVGMSLLAFLGFSIFHGAASGDTVPHGTVELVANQDSLQPGRTIWAGLYFQLEPGWHIYWTNPGDSGEPPRVQWNLPAGVEAGPLEWPTPRRITDHSLTDYGYQNQILLPVKITVAAGTKLGTDVQLGARVNWLVCGDICVPGRAVLALTLPVRKGVPPQPSAAQRVFAKTLADLPRLAPSSWRTTATIDRRQFVLTIDRGKQIAAATFFPTEPNQVENSAVQKATPLSRGIRLEIPKSDQLLMAPTHLAGVLALSSGQAYLIKAPVAASK